MRNLKRALSLALASVMLLGMMVVGTSAASYPDVDENDNVEAIEVLNAVNVMIGRQGNFEPDEAVNRHEMAVIMAKLYLGVEAADNYVGSHPFTDVVPWADKYVAACYENGLVAGTSATTYGGGNPLTAVQAAAMMLRALGYVDLSKGADDWRTPVTATANRIRLFAGVASNPSAKLTRNDVAQLALNTLESTMVDLKDNTFDITTSTGGATTTVVGGNREYTVRASTDFKVSKAISAVETEGNGADGKGGATVELGEHLYNGNLRKLGISDGFQAPATRWSYKNTEIVTYTSAEDYKLEGGVKSSAMYSAVGKTVAENYYWEVYMDGSTTNRNSDKPLFTQADVKDNDSDSLNGTGNGTVTYVYLSNTARSVDGTTYAGTATVCILNTYAAEVTKVKDGKITLDDKDRQLEVEAAGCAEGDVVLYTKHVDGTGWKVGTVLGKAELVEAKADTVRAGKFVKIGDKTYNYNAQFNTKNGGQLAETYAGQDVALYLDGQGNIVYLGDAKEGADYALVMGVGRSAQYNEAKPLYGAELMLSDGTYKNVLLDKDLTDGILKAGAMTKADMTNASEAAKLECIRNALVGRAFAYSVNKDNSFDLTSKVGGTDRTVSISNDGNAFNDTAGLWKEVGKVSVSTEKVLSKDKASAKLSTFIIGSETLRFDNDTIFILNDYTDGTTDFNVYTGYKNVPDVFLTKDSTVSAYKNANGVARVVFITDASIDAAKDVVFIVGDSGAKIEKTGSTTYKNYKAVVNGEVRTVSVKNGDALTAVEAQGDDICVYAGITFNTDGYVTKLKEIDGTKLAVNSDKNGGFGKEYVGTNNEKKGVYSFGYKADENGKVTWSTTYASNDKVVIVYYGEYDGKNGQLHVETRLNNDSNDKAWVVTDDGEVVAIFVVELKDGEDNKPGPQTGDVYLADDLVGKNVGSIKDSKVKQVDDFGKTNATFTLVAPDWAYTDTVGPDDHPIAEITFDIYRDGEAFKHVTKKITADADSNHGYLTANGDGTFTGTVTITNSSKWGLTENEAKNHQISLRVTDINWRFAKVEYFRGGNKITNVSGVDYLPTFKTDGGKFTVTGLSSGSGSATVKGLKTDVGTLTITSGEATLSGQAKGGETVKVNITGTMQYTVKIGNGTGSPGMGAMLYLAFGDSGLLDADVAKDLVDKGIDKNDGNKEKKAGISFSTQTWTVAENGTVTIPFAVDNLCWGAYVVVDLVNVPGHDPEPQLFHYGIGEFTIKNVTENITLYPENIKVTPVYQPNIVAASVKGQYLAVQFDKDVTLDKVGGDPDSITAAKLLESGALESAEVKNGNIVMMKWSSDLTESGVKFVVPLDCIKAETKVDGETYNISFKNLYAEEPSNAYSLVNGRVSWILGEDVSKVLKSWDGIKGIDALWPAGAAD